MEEALRLAGIAGDRGDVPVGALVLDASDQVIGRGFNQRQALGRPLAHAEMEAIGKSDMGWDLAGCTMVVTLEPCPMCAGALMACHFSRVVFGAWDPKIGACGSVWDLPRDPHTGSKVEVLGGVCEQACAGILADFFARHRQG